MKHAFLMTFSFLMSIVISACGVAPSATLPSPTSAGQQSAATNERVVVKAWYHQYGEKEAIEFLNQWTDEYNASQDKITLETTVVSGGVQDYYNKLTTAFASGEGPDIFEMDAADFLKYYQVGITTPLDDLISGDIRADFSEAALNSYTMPDGKLHAMPFIIDAIGLYYDKDALAEAGVAPPTTWDELKDAAKKLTTPERKGLVISPVAGGYAQYEFWPFLWAAGGNVLDTSGQKSAFDSDGTRKALQLYRDLSESGVIFPSLQSDSWDISYLLNGQTAMQICGIWATPKVEASKKNIGLIPYPAVDSSGKPTSVVGGWNIIINSKSKHIAEAKEVVKWTWLEGTDRMGQFNTVGGFHLAPRKSVLEAKKDIYGKPIYADWVNTVAPLGQKSLSLPPEVASTVQGAIQKALFQKTPIDQLVTDTDAELQALLNK